MSTIRYNWKPVVNDFFKMAQKIGFEVTHVDDGEGYEEIPPKTNRKTLAVEMVCSVDESRVNFIHTPTKTRIAGLFILGNGPEEICSDWTISSNEEANKAFDTVATNFYSKWKDRKTPTIKAKKRVDSE